MNRYEAIARIVEVLLNQPTSYVIAFQQSLALQPPLRLERPAAPAQPLLRLFHPACPAPPLRQQRA